MIESQEDRPQGEEGKSMGRDEAWGERGDEARGGNGGAQAVSSTDKPSKQHNQRQLEATTADHPPGTHRKADLP